jgi:hypothetical protein
LDAVLSSSDPTIDSEDGHPIAYTAILQAAQSYEHRPIFLREDSEQITSDPVMAEKVPKWMNTAAQVATGNRARVLEDGPDKMNSDEEDAGKEEHGDDLKGVYAPGCSSLDQARMTQAQVAAQKAAAQAQKRVPPHSQSPVGGSSDDDDPAKADEMIWLQTNGCLRRNKFYKAPAAPASPEKVISPRLLQRQPHSSRRPQAELTRSDLRLLRKVNPQGPRPRRPPQLYQ